MVKIVRDEDLSDLHKHTQGIAKDFAKQIAVQVVGHIVDIFKEDKKFGDLNYSGLMTFLHTINTEFFLHLFGYTCFVGSTFPDADHSTRDLFEEYIEGLRIRLQMPVISKKEYENGIKKI